MQNIIKCHLNFLAHVDLTFDMSKRLLRKQQLSQNYWSSTIYLTITPKFHTVVVTRCGFWLFCAFGV